MKENEIESEARELEERKKVGWDWSKWEWDERKKERESKITNNLKYGQKNI